MKQPIYLISNKITFKNFKKVWKKFPNGDIVPESFIDGKIVWQMIKDMQIYVYIDPKEKDDPVIFAIKLPKKRIIKIIK